MGRVRRYRKFKCVDPSAGGGGYLARKQAEDDLRHDDPPFLSPRERARMRREQKELLKAMREKGSQAERARKRGTRKRAREVGRGSTAPVDEGERVKKTGGEEEEEDKEDDQEQAERKEGEPGRRRRRHAGRVQDAEKEEENEEEEEEVDEEARRLALEREEQQLRESGVLAVSVPAGATARSAAAAAAQVLHRKQPKSRADLLQQAKHESKTYQKKKEYLRERKRRKKERKQQRQEQQQQQQEAQHERNERWRRQQRQQEQQRQQSEFRFGDRVDAPPDLSTFL